ncbi:MAG: SbcC/MukB-like Walker B domain-containing protein, partial [Actinomycetes bacterium]
GDVELAALIQKHAAATASAERAERLAEGLDAGEQALASFDREHDTWTRDQVAQGAEARSLATDVTELRARVTAVLDVVAEARGDDPSVGARADRLDRVVDDLDMLAGQLAEVERLEVAVDDAVQRAEAGVAARRLDSLDAVARAVRDDDRLTQLEQRRRAHDEELAAVTEQLADQEMTAIAARPPVELTDVVAAATAAASERDRSVSHAASTGARSEALSRLQTALQETLERRAPLADRHRVVDRLSRLAEGKSTDNRLRMSLSSYVLAARLEQVAASATERLLRMSSGRYSLLHSAEGASGRARGGLSLRVLDAWTGLERDPASLSGGESFSASLALALGLADVVTAEASGALLETLFVDEGFGSLDDETLDEVMGVLDDLRDGGRSVGLVSHVADLRQRIPVQLQVQKGRSGSTVRQ